MGEGGEGSVDTVIYQPVSIFFQECGKLKVAVQRVPSESAML